MKQLDFIADTTYRSALKEMFAELDAVASTRAWRASMVIAGGIFESLLTLYLLTKKQAAGTEIDPTKLPIEKSMAACIKLGMTAAGSNESKKLVLNYRKLIHASADVRLRVQILDADVHEARMVLDKILEFISPKPVPWEDPDESGHSLVELEMKDDPDSEHSWSGDESTDKSIADVAEDAESVPKAETNIRRPGATTEEKTPPTANGKEANIRLPVSRATTASKDEPSASTVEPALDPQQSSVGGSTPEQINIRPPGVKSADAVSANGAAAVNEIASTKQHSVPQGNTLQPGTASRSKPDSADASDPVPAQPNAALAVPAKPPPEQPAPAAVDIDPRMAIRALDTAVDRNLRGPQITELISTLEPRLQYELLKVLIPKSALRIHIGKDTITEVDRIAAFLTLRDMFRQLLDRQTDELRAEILIEHVAALQGEHQTRGVVFVDYFFEAADLQYLPNPVAEALKKHIFQRMEKHQNSFFLDAITDIWFYMTKEEIDEFINVCLSCIIYGATHEMRMDTKAWLKRNAWEKMDDALRAEVLAPLQRWIENYEFFNDTSHATLVKELKAIAERR